MPSTDPHYRLILGDCIDILQEMPDRSIDCIVTDPPYGVGVHFANVQDDAATVRKVIEVALPEMRRVAHRVVIIPGIPYLMEYPKPTWILAYLKYGTLCRWGLNRWNPILVYGDDPLRRLRMYRPDTIGQSSQRKQGVIGHPSVKPLWLMRKLIDRVTAPSNNILDPFMGSGTTGVAAIQLGRAFTGIEINSDYLAIARQRIEAARPDFPPLSHGAIG